MVTQVKKLSTAEAKRMHDLAKKHLYLSERQLDLPGGVPVYIKEEGVYVWDVEGRKYIDGWGGLMYKNVGYGRKEVIEAVVTQMRQMTSPPLPGPTDITVELAAKLASHMPGEGEKHLEKMFLSTGGGEAIELAVKMARQYQRNSGFPNRNKIIARRGEYHGSSSMTMGLGVARNYEVYGPFPPNIVHIPIPHCYRCPYGLTHPDCGILCAKELEETIKFEGPNLVAAFLMTGICQSTAVFGLKPEEYTPMVRAICDKYGVLLIDDEVVSGFCRSGKFFAIEHANVAPDIMCVAKGLTCGYQPLGAAVSSRKVANAFEGKKGLELFRHSITYGGMAPACAAGIAVMEIYEKEKLAEKTAAIGPYVEKKLEVLKAHPSVGDIRGVGLLWAIEMVKNKKTKEPITTKEADQLANMMMDAGFIVATSYGVIRFIPPLIITKEQIDESIAIMDKVIPQFEKAVSIR